MALFEYNEADFERLIRYSKFYILNSKTMADCIFCKLVSGEMATQFVYEGEKCVAFNDINPKAATHVLIVPKKHIDSVMTLEEEDRDIVADMVYTAKKVAEKLNLEGYKLTFHVGEKGGQEIFHIHLHLLAGE